MTNYGQDAQLIDKGGMHSVWVDSVKQDGRFTVNHLGRSAGVIVGG